MLAPLGTQGDERVQATEICTPKNHINSGAVPRENFRFEGLNSISDRFFEGKPMDSSPSSMDVDNDDSMGNLSAVATEFQNDRNEQYTKKDLLIKAEGAC